MDNFQSGFALELCDIMSKQAASKASAPSPTKAKQLAVLMSTEKGQAALKNLRHGTKRVAVGSLAHKIINPDATTGSAIRTGAGMAAGGAIGASLAKQIGFKGVKGALAGSFLGSALGIRAMRRKHPKKTDRELLEMSLKKEGQQLVATATVPRRDATSGATPAPQRQAPPKSNNQIITDPKTGARGTAAQLAENTAAGARMAKEEKMKAGIQQGASALASKAKGLAKSWGIGGQKPSGGIDFSKYKSLNQPAATKAPPRTQAAPVKNPNLSSTGTTNAQRFSAYMP